MKKIAVYPGSFNPFHEGHISIINKAMKIFDEIHIVPSINTTKDKNVNLEKIVADIKAQVNGFQGVTVVPNDSQLTVEYANSIGAHFLIRGLRTQSDFDYELELYDGNKMLDKNIETVFFVSDMDKRDVTSSIKRQIEEFQNLLEEKNSDQL